MRGEWMQGSTIMWAEGEMKSNAPHRVAFWDTYMESGVAGQNLFYRERHFGPLMVVERSYPTAAETHAFFATKRLSFYDRRYVLKIGPVAFSVSMPDDVLEVSIWRRLSPRPGRKPTAKKQ
jgi:hypothetical protein